MAEIDQKKSNVMGDMKIFYFIPTCVLCGVLLLSIIATVFVICNNVEWTVGIIVFSIVDVLLLILALTSMVAMYREMSRIHDRETVELEEQNEELKEKNKELKDQNEELKEKNKKLNEGFEKRIADLEKQIKDLEKKLEEKKSGK